jgi:hypothetical protein
VTAGTRGQGVTATLRPSITDARRIAKGTTPPTLARCNAVGRTCFTPQALYSAYNIGPDLHVFDQAFGLPPMCGEENVTCAPGMPTFTVFHPKASSGTGAARLPVVAAGRRGLERADAGPGYPATTGWDPVTGLEAPNAANLIPDLVAAGHGH